MPTTSFEFLESAERCCAEDCEIGYRNAISRAYYAMYHEVKGNLTSLPSYSRDHHSNLIGYLRNKAENKLEPFEASKLKSMAYKLEQQRLSRNDADYDLGNCAIDKNMAEQCLLEVKAVFTEWQQMKTDLAV